MAIKDSVFTWFIQNIISPNIEVIDKPGFVVTKFSEKGKETYLRELFLEEKLIQLIEDRIVEKFGEKGEQALYSAGKKFGYIYSDLSNFPQLSETNQKEIEDFSYFLVRFVSVLYAKDAKSKIDLNTKRFECEFDNYIVCNKNGKGHLMTAGGIAGIWSFIMADKQIEGFQKTCQGRGADKCLVICQKDDPNNKDIRYREVNIESHKYVQEYRKLNDFKRTQFAKNSLKSLIDSRFFSYKDGTLSYKDSRYFYCEADMVYILENEISKLDHGKEVLFDAAFEFGQQLQKMYGGKDFSRFINDYFSALGWGDVIVSNKNPVEIISVSYPWTTYSNESTYTTFCGILSGFISASTDTKTILQKRSTAVTDCLTVKLYAN